MADYSDEKYEWNVEKSALNFWRHGFDFFTAAIAFEVEIYREIADECEDEDRFVRFAVVNDLMIRVVYTVRDGRNRIITARRASRQEQDAYAKEFGREA